MSREMRDESIRSSVGIPADDVVQGPDLKMSRKPSTPTGAIIEDEESDSDSEAQKIEIKPETAPTHTGKKRAVGGRDTTKARTDKKIKLESENQQKKGRKSVDQVGHSREPSSSTGARGGKIEDNKKSDFPRVLKEDGISWRCMLNQTVRKENENKFYEMKLLQNDESGNYTVQTRNGRVGKPGKKLYPEENVQNVSIAKKKFVEKFWEKTGNKWNCGDNFEKKDRKYDLVYIDEDDGRCGPNEAGVEMHCTYEAPLGKLSGRQIKAGHRALIDIQNIVKQSSQSADNEALLSACDKFYTRIPHSSEMKVHPPLIDTMSMVQDALKLFVIPGHPSSNE